MSEDNDSQPPVTTPVPTKEALTGSGGLRKGADMLVPPPKAPVGDGPAAMPVNMAPTTPAASPTPAPVVGNGEGS